MSLPESALSEGFPWLLTINDIPIKAEAKGFEDADVLIKVAAARLGAAADRLEHLPALVCGTPVEAELTHETGIYQVKLELLELTQEHGDLIMRLRLDEILNRLQRRQAFRMKLLANAKIAVVGTSFHYEALVRDLSETGVGLWARDLSELVSVGSEVRIDFTAASLGEFSHRAIVRRHVVGATTGSVEVENEADGGGVTLEVVQKMNCVVGAEILHVDDSEAHRIRTYLWNLQRERRDRGIV